MKCLPLATVIDMIHGRLVAFCHLRRPADRPSELSLKRSLGAQGRLASPGRPTGRGDPAGKGTALETAWPAEVVYLPAVTLTLVNRCHLRANVFAERSANIWTIWAGTLRKSFTVAFCRPIYSHADFKSIFLACVCKFVCK